MNIMPKNTTYRRRSIKRSVPHTRRFKNLPANNANYSQRGPMKVDKNSAERARNIVASLPMMKRKNFLKSMSMKKN
jgi:hypothetical protein